MANPANYFKPGESGNPKGRPPKEWTWSGLLREMMDQKEEDGELVKSKMAKALKLKGYEGDVQALKEIGNRIDGMPAQAIKLSGDEENPIKVDVTSSLLKAYGPDNPTITGSLPEDG